MKQILFLLAFLCMEKGLQSQYIYTIKADSVKITNSCDTAELIVENHTQTVPGFLFNKGRGRTEFRRALQRVNDNLYLIGADTLKLNAWMQGGNSWGTTGVFGTMDNNSIDIYTNNAVRGRWTNTGNLLIGTTTDDNFKLKVSGNAIADRLYASAYTADDAPMISLQNEAGDFSNYMGSRGNDMVFHVRDYTGTYRFAFGPYDPQFNKELAISGGNDGRIYVTSPNFHIGFAMTNSISDETDPIHITSNSGNTLDGIVVQRGPRSTSMLDPIFTAREGTDDVFKVLRNGYVGIGAPAPQAQLHTTGTVRFGGLTNDNSLTRIVVSDIYGNLAYRDASSLAVNDRMNSDLAVNGTVSAQKMLIAQTGRWPDYVFAKQYYLPSLMEVESFINQNSHLPGVPSAAEVEKKGIDVANNQAALLKKIEELTLYAIEQEKKMQRQNEEMESLKQQMSELKALIKSNSQSVK
ncbi:hypothetical protein A4D02_32220 [Niastella koreensis]|uniref:Uncharacterized protein n=2 Tax=Niastella koreensis TaxID=354356 RepID=G8TBX5_NIAKG|nr:hypothetical protein [Niastella koreensis]AEV99268.1 hypothetical protein Niako_2937 [Niastella koreensis GR20-10]OQP46057.1 hypothetical protein A4D02_32220 [Niastella koreensis]